MPTLRVDKIDMSAEDLETVTYLEVCMQEMDERGRLARCLYNLIALGKTTAHEVGLAVGTFDPNGIALDTDYDVSNQEILGEDSSTQASQSTGSHVAELESSDDVVVSDHEAVVSDDTVTEVDSNDRNE